MSTLVNVGDVLAGKYRVEKVLGIGGMGMVVAALHLELEQRVALKFMLPEAMRSAQAVDRFLREAKSAVKLRSEHICRVLDVGKLANGAPYIVMEFMEGQDFAGLISERGPLPAADAVDYLLQAIEGVAEAHANKIVHRDLKPGNLFVTTKNDGSPLVKVLDFGISKSSIAGAPTKTGDMMGSPSYMAPEQMLSSKDVDSRADVWALGVILYQALTGHLPFDADTLPALCMAVMHTEPRAPTELRPDLAPAFGAVVMRCLDKRIDQRFPDVGALAAALVPFGRPDAAASAERVAKVINRTGAAKLAPAAHLAPTLMATTDAAAIASAPTPAATSLARELQPIGRVSTLQASAGSLDSSVGSTRVKRRVGIIAGISAAAVVAALIMIVMATRSGGDSGPSTTSTVQSTTTGTAAQPTVPPTAPPNVSTVATTPSVTSPPPTSPPTTPPRVTTQPATTPGPQATPLSVTVAKPTATTRVAKQRNTEKAAADAKRIAQEKAAAEAKQLEAERAAADAKRIEAEKTKPVEKKRRDEDAFNH